MDTSKIRKDWERGKAVDVGALLDSIDSLQQRIAELEKSIKKLTKSDRIEEPFSLAAEEKRQQKRKAARKARNKSLK